MGIGLSPYAVVRVKLLLQEQDQYEGWGFNARPPAVGDSGCLVDVLHAPGEPDKFVVECSGSDGITVWLAEFFAEEIEIA